MAQWVDLKISTPPSVFSSEEGYGIQTIDSGKSDEVIPSQETGGGCIARVRAHATQIPRPLTQRGCKGGSASAVL